MVTQPTAFCYRTLANAKDTRNDALMPSAISLKWHLFFGQKKWHYL